MSKYLGMLTYSVEGIQGLENDTANSRRQAVEKAIARIGGKIESFYFTADEANLVMIADFPGTTSATGIVLAVSSVGLGRLRWTELLTAEGLDEALKVSTKYRSPGSST